MAQFNRQHLRCFKFKCYVCDVTRTYRHFTMFSSSVDHFSFDLKDWRLFCEYVHDCQQKSLTKSNRDFLCQTTGMFGIGFENKQDSKLIMCQSCWYSNMTQVSLKLDLHYFKDNGVSTGVFS